MGFNTLPFIFIFLPVFLAVYYLMPERLRNGVLTLGSLVFYLLGTWKRPWCLALLLGLMALTWLSGRKLAGSKPLLVGNLLVLGLCLFGFKYAGLLGSGIALPLGLSFYSFQMAAYVIDVYREPQTVSHSFKKVLLYIAFFPQLIAGPIVKYHDVEQEIDSRRTTPQETALGIRRFICGLSKKLLLSNALGQMADTVFALPAGEIGMLAGWTGAICYTLQIYFDFSGYSDMAIGLGRMFGFHFRENFNYPYTATTIKEFWRRWHISLSGWFRDYLYIPLGGNRKGNARTWLNRFLVFFATGLWHGASWTFVLWGLWHGLFSVLEDCGAIPVDKLKGKRIGQLYTLLVVVLGFTLFRADTLAQAGAMYAAMFSGIGLHWLGTAAVWAKFTPAFALTLCLALLLCTPVAREHTPKRESVTFIGSLGLLLLCMMYLAAGSFNPFIYFRF